MLSESVLEELARNTALRQELVSMAWPSLSVESKLQLIEAIQGKGISASSPNWLVDLALADGADIVRLWAARFAYFREPAKPNALAFLGSPTEKDLARTENARNDPNPLVRACVSKTDSFTYEWLTALPQTERLLALRNLTSSNFASFISWLETAVAAGIPGAELRDCATEFLALPVVKDELNTPETEQDPYHAYELGKAMEKGWEFAKTAPPPLQSMLAFALPLKVGQFSKMKAEQLATLPAELLERILYIPSLDSTDETEKLKKLILSQPERFPEKLVQQFKRHTEEDSYLDAEAIRRWRQTHRLDSSTSTMEEIFALRDQLSAMTEQLSELAQAVREKKGLIF